MLESSPAVLRALTRVVALLVIGSLQYLVYVVVYAALQVAPRTARRWRTLMYRQWAKSVAKWLGMRAEYYGQTPAGTFILAANHTSYADIPLLARVFDVAFVAKEEVRTWPFVGVLARSVGTIFVDRQSRRDSVRVSGHIDREISSGRSVAFFPEGTSTSGEEILPFKPPLLDVAAKNRVPVYPAAIHYRTPYGYGAARDLVCWGDDTPFTTHIWRLLKIPHFTAVAKIGAPRVNGDRKMLANDLWNDVNSMYEELRRAPESGGELSAEED